MMIESLLRQFFRRRGVCRKLKELSRSLLPQVRPPPRQRRARDLISIAQDETIAAGLGNLEDEYGTGIQSEEFGSEGQYGPVHDWQADPQGSVVRDAANPSGRSDLQSWLDDRRAAFDALVETYSGEASSGKAQDLEQAIQTALNRRSGMR